MDQTASVELADGAGQGHGEPEELSDLHRLPDETIEGFATSVIDNQHRLPALAHQLQRPQRPGTIQVGLESVFVREAIDTLKGGMLGAGRDGYEGVRLATGAIPPELAESTAGVSPQHVERVVFPTSSKQDGCLHKPRLPLRAGSRPAPCRRLQPIRAACLTQPRPAMGATGNTGSALLHQLAIAVPAFSAPVRLVLGPR